MALNYCKAHTSWPYNHLVRTFIVYNVTEAERQLVLDSLSATYESIQSDIAYTQ